jgi:hypothetical protein
LSKEKVNGQLFAASPDLNVDIPSRIEVRDYVVDEEHLSGFFGRG